MELWVNEFWLLFTALIFTAYGWYMGVRNKVEQISETVIDTLIEQQYLKTRGTGKDLEILKHTEWQDD